MSIKSPLATYKRKPMKVKEEAGVAPPKERKRRVKKADGVDRVGDPRQLPTANNTPELE